SSPNVTTAQVVFTSTHNIYVYKPILLILSYYIAFLHTIPSVCLGLYAPHINGVAHSTYFSAIIATTWNPGLDVLSDRGNTFSLDSETSNPSLRFGEDKVGMKGERAAIGMANE
ncbi:hypothetical protein F5882DRAFT_498439, partial [Hyaloscypha sp. PMI_1271]